MLQQVIRFLNVYSVKSGVWVTSFETFSRWNSCHCWVISGWSFKVSDCCYEISHCCSWCWCESKSARQCFLNSLRMMFKCRQHTLKVCFSFSPICATGRIAKTAKTMKSSVSLAINRKIFCIILPRVLVVKLHVLTFRIPFMFKKEIWRNNKYT